MAHRGWCIVWSDSVLNKKDVKEIGFFDTPGRLYRKFSNFHIHPSTLVTPNGKLTFNCIENAFQASKDLNKAELFLDITPTEAKKLGGSRTEIDLRKDWNDYRTIIMNELIDEKFNDPSLAAALLSTGDEILVEYNSWHDNFWGHCVCDKCQYKEKENVLGKLIMIKRESLSNISK